MKKFLTASVLTLATTWASASFAGVDQRVIYCDSCNETSVALREARTNDAKYLIIDLGASTATEVLVKQQYGSAEEEEHPEVTIYRNKPYLQTVNGTLREIGKINDEIQRASQLPIDLQENFSFTSVSILLESSNAIDGFESELNHLLTTDRLAEIVRRASNQIDYLNSDLNPFWGGFKISFNDVVRDSTWVALFNDGTTIEVKITFENVDGKVVAKAKTTRNSAKDKDKNPIPYHRLQINNFTYEGSHENTEHMVNYMRSLGVTVDIPAVDNSAQCTFTGMVCNADGCDVFYSCRN